MDRQIIAFLQVRTINLWNCQLVPRLCSPDICTVVVARGPCSVIGIATVYGLDGPGIEFRWGEIFRTCPDRPWGPLSILYSGYPVFTGGKVLPGRAADHSPPSSAVVKE